MKIPFVDLQVQYRAIKNEVDTTIQKVLDSSAYVLGPAVKDFEEKFAVYLGARHAVGVSSGTDAIHIVLRALGIGPGDEVITVANTFIATAEGISLVGATPVFTDADEKTFNIDVSKIEKAITKKTRAIIPVHLYGQAADMDPVMEIAKRHKLFVIEDACQAHGAEYKGKKLGTIGDIAVFSFYPGKNLGTYGEGGGLVTNNADWAEMARKLRDHGSAKKYHHDLIGGNFRISGIEGAVLGAKLPHLDSWNTLRRAHADTYRKLLSSVGDLILPIEPSYSKGNYHLFVIRTKRRDELQKYLSDKEIGTNIHYPIPIHLQPAYSFLKRGEGSFPVAEKLGREILSLPMYPELTEEMIEYVASAIKDFFKK